MPFDVRTITEDEVPEYQRQLESAFGGDPEPDELASWRPLVETDRTIGAYDDGRMVGTAAVFTFDMTVPGGGPRPCAGVTGVSVRPTHRRQGALNALMRHQLDTVVARGTEAFASLWASEASIYGRFGYGVASRRWGVTISGHDPALLGRAPTGRVRFVDADETAVLAPPVYDAYRADRPGMISRSPERWHNRLTDLPHHRNGASTQRLAVYERDGEVRGYAWYRTKGEWTDNRPQGVVRLKELVALDADAHGGLWRFLLGVDLMTSVAAENVPADDPVFHRLPDMRVAKVNVMDGLYVRLLDVPKALTDRGYDRSDDVVLEVVDAFGGWAAGRYALDATPDGATCEATTATADLTLSAADLGAVYLGDTPLRTLHGAGRVDEHTPGSAERASLLLSWPRAAWCPEIF
jgi:predicted acetyltransferase